MNATPSAAQAALVRLVKRDSARAVARRVGVTENAVRKWLALASKPGAKPRAKLVALGVPDAWDVPVTKISAVAPAPPDAIDDGGPLDAEQEARITLRELRAEMRRLRADPAATPRERAQVAASLNSATRILGKLSGATELTAATIIRAPAFRHAVEALVAALRPFPEALDAAAAALRALESSA